MSRKKGLKRWHRVAISVIAVVIALSMVMGYGLALFAEEYPTQTISIPTSEVTIG